ncbi:MAG: hypothetical protein WAV28_12795 [Sedimentisphaerales bacterium]|jgi:hypothetical protein
MKKTFTQKIIVFVAVSLITAGFALAQNVAEEESQPASKETLISEKEAELARREAETAAKVAQKEADITQKQMKVAQKEIKTQEKNLQAQLKQLELQIPEIPEIELAIPRVSIPVWQHSGSGEVLVIPAAELKVEDLAAITEDMSVMSRIFDNKLIQAHLTTARASWFVGFDPFSERNIGTTEAIYLEGYAALFLIRVNFPLSPPAEEKEEKETEEGDTDPLWTQTKQEMFEPEEAGTRSTTERQEEKYDARKVAELKETLIKTLKHAANIRALKPDQSVILTVISGQSQSGTTTTTRSYGRSGMSSSISRGRSSMRGRITGRRAPGTETGSFLPTVLTICAKKSDIDAFAKGELSFDQFRERTRIFSSYAKVADAGLPGVEVQTVAKARPLVF